MYHVLIGVDEDVTHARNSASEVVSMPGAASEKHVTLVHSFADSPAPAAAADLEPVEAATEVLTAAGIDYDVTESSGDPATSIVEAAREVDADLIVIGGRKRSPAGKALFGSVSQQVILTAERAVMVTGLDEDA